ncbi:MAG: hypothetical protein ACRDHZ_09045, partial [Ktedonobacteraceae bacterium]
VPHEHAVKQSAPQQERLVLISPKTGSSLVLSGDGIQLLDKEGHSLAALSQSDGNPELKLTQWTALSPFQRLLSQSVGKPATLKEGGSLDLHPTLIYMTRCALFTCQDNASLNLDGGPTLVLNSPDNTDGFGNLGLWEANRCFDAKATCYATRVALNQSLGLTMTTCKTKKGVPLSKANKDEGCESVHVGTAPLGEVSKGARITLREDGKARLVIGRAILTSPSVGGQEITPLSQITAFDKKGKVIWKMLDR